MADFPLDFPVVFTVSIIMLQLRYIIVSCQSFQTVSFSDLRNISLQILHIGGSSSERRQSHVMSKATITLDYYKALGLTKSPLFGAARIDQASSCNGQNYRPKASYDLYSAIMLSV